MLHRTHRFSLPLLLFFLATLLFSTPSLSLDTAEQRATSTPAPASESLASNPVYELMNRFSRFFRGASGITSTRSVTRTSGHLSSSFLLQRSASSTMSSTPPTQPTSDSSTAPASHTPLPLPAPEQSSSDKIQLDVSTGESIALDHLGPLVVNVDGSLSRIANWDKMAEIEKKNTLRIIGKRNKARLEALKKAEGEGEVGKEEL